MSSFASLHPRGCQRALGLVPSDEGDGMGDSCRVIQDLSLLLEISQTMESSLEVRDLMRPTLRKLAESIGMKRGAISLLDRETGSPAVEEVVGLARHESPAHYWQDARPLFEQVVQSGQALVVTDISKDEHFRHRCPPDGWNALADPPLAFLCVPIKHATATIGTLSLERCVTASHSFAADLRLLTVIARMIAQAAHLRYEAESRIASLRRENERLQEQIAQGFKPTNMVGSSNAMRSVYLHIEQVAASDTTVLIRGESGVGKELVARALHDGSPRKPRAFMKVNCAALPESIIESELFGHEKGAFTGAIALRRGRFEVADRGTIFLDEIGDLAPATQVKLLRVLQEREFERVGSQETIRCDVRVIAATSRNLEEMMENGRFRPDLYYRLNVFPIYIPPLRERKADLLQLADHFLETFAKRSGRQVRRISTAAIDLLMAYHWPGNVRELENCLERAVLLVRGDAVEAQHLPPTLQMGTTTDTPPHGTLESALRGLEHELICAELKRTKGNMAEAARNLGITERIIGLRVKEFRIDPRRFRRTRPAASEDGNGD